MEIKKYKTGLMPVFAREAANDEGSSRNDLVDAILRERPDLKGEMVYIPEQGKEAHTIFIGDEVFKAPCESKAHYPATLIHFMDQEVDILKRLEGKGLPVPRVTYEGKDAAFYGMTRLPGIPLGFDFEESLNGSQLRMLAQDIIDFVIKMAKAVPQDSIYGFLMNMDMHGGNILIDPETKRLCGVIDFGNVEESHEWRIAYPYEGRFAKILMEEFRERKLQQPKSVPPGMGVRYSIR